MEIRDAQVLVPAWVATALVAIHQDRTQDAIEIMEELDRETEVSLAWYRENFLADLVRVCVASDALPLARRLVERSHPTARRHHLSLLSASAAMAEASGDVAGPRGSTNGRSRDGATTAIRWRRGWRCSGPGGVSSGWVMPDRPTCVRGPSRSSPGCKPNPR